MAGHGFVPRSQDGREMKDVQAISKGIAPIYFGRAEGAGIKFVPCFYSAGYLQCGSFCLEGEGDGPAQTAFVKLCSHIRKNYKRNPRKSCYIGTGVYYDWLNRLHCFPFLLEYESFFVEEQYIHALFQLLAVEGYQIKTRHSRLGQDEIPNWNAESYVIFDASSNMQYTIVARKKIRYEWDSECIFVFRDRKTKRFEFVLDKRIAENETLKVVLLYNILRDCQWVCRE